MRLGFRRGAAVLAITGLIVSACSSGATTAPSQQPAASTAPSAAAASAAAGAPAKTGWPYTGTLKDGTTFTLNPRIADKLANGGAINYYFNYGSTSIPLFSPQYLKGYQDTLPQAQKILPTMVGVADAPASAVQDMNAQIAMITAKWKADQFDCLSVQSTGTDTFTKIVNDIEASGIPVFTVGVESNGNELSNFTQISHKEGLHAAQIVVDWMKKTGNNLTTFAVSGGDPTQNWAIGRMQGFIDGITAAVPGAKFANDVKGALTTTYDPAGTYDAYKAFLQGNPSVQFIENVDIGAEHADRAIKDAGLTGKVFTIGWNVSIGQLDAVQAGTQVAALDQAWGDQAGFGALACAEFLKNGKILPNSNVLKPVTKDNVDAARAAFMQFVGK
jgi:ABC-type sugar transport system substrate-binding protein